MLSLALCFIVCMLHGEAVAVRWPLDVIFSIRSQRASDVGLRLSAPSKAYDVNGNEIILDEDAIAKEVSKLLVEVPMKRLREERNQRLVETDWWAVKDVTMSQARKDYRQALRDLPSTASPKIENGQLTNVTWPTKPT